MLTPAVIRSLVAAVCLLIAAGAHAAVEQYTVDPSHTYPSFTAPHIGGISNWRGKIDKSSGIITLDRDTKTGTVAIVMDMKSIDFGLDQMNTHARSADIFDVEQFPTATFKASRVTYAGDVPSEIPGELTLHGVTRPLTVKINSFKCITHPVLKKEVCGADATAEFDRADYGVAYAIPLTGSGKVTLSIQVEAFKDDKTAAR